MGGLTAQLEQDGAELPSLAERRRAELRADVAVMRELGVTSWQGITLGDAPSGEAAPDATREAPPEDEVTRARREREAKRKRYTVEFGVRPNDKLLDDLP